MNVFGDWDLLLGVVLVVFAWRRNEAKGGTAPQYDAVVPFVLPPRDVSPDDPADRVGYPVEPCLFFGALLAYGCTVAIVGEGHMSAILGAAILAAGGGAYGLLLVEHYRPDGRDCYPAFLLLFSASLLVFTVTLTLDSSQVGAWGGAAFLACTAGAYVLGGRP